MVTLVCELVKAGRAPNLNTYRIVLNACQRCEQGSAVLEIFSLLREKRMPILQHKFAQTIYYTVLKACFGQMRAFWRPLNGSLAPYHSSSSTVLRLNEAEKLVHALRSVPEP